MNRAVSLLMQLVSSEVFSKPLASEYKEPISEEMGRALYALASAHDLAHIAASAIVKNKLLPEGELLESFKKTLYLAVFRQKQLSAEASAVSELLSESGIEHILLKGSVIRELYPEKWMRTSCDVDILVRDSDLERAAALMVSELGYERGQRGSHDVTMIAPGGVHIELHFNLLEEARLPEAADILGSVWDYAEPLGEGNYALALRDEFFCFYHIAHMAKHFTGSGGCGIRPFIDLLLLGDGNSDKRKELLAKGGLLRFFETAVLLGKHWFFDAEASDVISSLSDFVIRGGTYGSARNSVAVKGAQHGGRRGYVLSRLFLPVSTLKERYPVLKRHIWLMPFMQIRRWFEMLFGGRLGRSVRELEVSRGVGEDETKRAAQLLRDIGLG